MLNKEALLEQFRKHFSEMTPEEAKGAVISLWKGYQSLVANFDDDGLSGMAVALEEAERLRVAYEALINHHVAFNRQVKDVAEKLKED